MHPGRIVRIRDALLHAAPTGRSRTHPERRQSTGRTRRSTRPPRPRRALDHARPGYARRR
ncbi:hypothetical protein FRAAL1564 [Frankia alni ACN14a]|uniref:Uncharacterized protein n=1 Tax=Frankia alni (strain DSM 45986 / CECT 9034 / ACN14a) TaxID=326424 RepID=Q0RQF6_FRAAA|nr:hypothetical protein FRAAL1564 [Frankia alni ACN14a]